MATLNTVDKVGRVLDLFSKDAPEWGVSEVASKLGVPRSSAHAVLSSLVDIGILRWRAGGRYRVGWRILELAEIHHRAVDLRGTAAPYLRALVEELGETCHLAVAERRKVLYVDKFLGTRNVIAQGARVGTHLEPHCTGVGKLLMAHADPSDVEDFLTTTKLQRYTTTTITDPAVLRAQLIEIRTRGFALDLGEAVEDVHCVAAPIRDDLGMVIAAISLSVPVNRFERSQARYVKTVLRTAGEISQALSDRPLHLTPETSDYPAPVEI
ncbi:IclR family transcriptional regulator [Granulicoccus phenolivorans]|uniref:IclR family transcriptional regulator n=1 Tax=Granulicoccus phenolivorans TaxID=266854 RepID=UPI0003FFC67F|nr:IclR family transcriptional regulator [Granulicoccus phenolivorans]